MRVAPLIILRALQLLMTVRAESEEMLHGNSVPNADSILDITRAWNPGYDKCSLRPASLMVVCRKGKMADKSWTSDNSSRLSLAHVREKLR